MTWTQERHAEVDERCKAATEGPWSCPPCAMDDGDGVWIESSGGYPICGLDESRLDTDGRFIACARMDLPDALVEIERLRHTLLVIATSPHPPHHECIRLARETLGLEAV